MVLEILDQLCAEKKHINNSSESEKIEMHHSCLCHCHGIEIGVAGHDNENSDINWEKVIPDATNIAVWVSDDVVTHFAGCDAKFGITRRKHHCRCGRLDEVVRVDGV